MERALVAATAWERFKRTASEEMTKFERQEAGLRDSERRERADKLHLPLDKASSRPKREVGPPVRQQAAPARSAGGPTLSPL